MGKGRYHHGDLRAAFLGAGREFLVERGSAGLTLRECAGKAGVSHAAPAYYFPTVDDLLAELAAVGFDDLRTKMEAAAATSVGAVNRLFDHARGYIAFALETPAVFLLMFDFHDHASRSAHFQAAAGKAYLIFTEAVSAAAPDQTPTQRQGTIDLMWSAIHGFAFLAIKGQFGTEQEVFKQRRDAVLAYLAVRLVVPEERKSKPIKKSRKATSQRNSSRSTSRQ